MYTGNSSRIENTLENTTITIQDVKLNRCNWIVTDLHVDVKNSNLSQMNFAVFSTKDNGQKTLGIVNSTLRHLHASNVDLDVMRCKYDYVNSAMFTFRNSTVKISESTFQGSHNELQIKQSRDGYFMGCKRCKMEIFSTVFKAMPIGMSIIVGVNSDISIEQSYFIGNQGASGKYASSNVTILDSTLEKNMGSLTIANGSRLFVENASFIENGGKITNYVYGVIHAYSDVNVLILRSRFIKNKAGFGGALTIGARVTLVAKSSNFEENESLVGGAINAYNHAILEIQQSTFVRNVVTSDWELDILPSHYESKPMGGAICVGYNSALSLKGCSFRNNTSFFMGGAILAQQSSDIYIESCVFEWNMAEAGGSIMAFKQIQLALTSTRFIGNLASNSIEEGINSLPNGGAISVKSNVTLYVANCEFDSNTADGGGIINIAFQSELQMYASVISKNIAKESGIIQGVQKVQIAMDKVIIFDNEAGDCLINIIDSEVPRKATFKMYNSYVYKNTGGIIMLYNTLQSVIENTTIFRNTGIKGNGGIMLTNTDFTVKNSSFRGNSIMRSQTGLIFANGRNTLQISRSNFSNNGVIGKGSVICALSSKSITITDSNFYSNSAGDKGGVVYFSSVGPEYSYLEISNSDFIGNRAGNPGSVLYSEGLNEAIFDSCRFSEADTQPYVYLLNSEILRTANTLFVTNTSQPIVKFQNTQETDMINIKTMNLRTTRLNYSLLSSHRNFLTMAIEERFILAEHWSSSETLNVIHEETIFASGTGFSMHLEGSVSKLG